VFYLQKTCFYQTSQKSGTCPDKFKGVLMLMMPLCNQYY